MNWAGTVTGRFGYSFGQWLPYVKGGVAAAQMTSPLQNGLVSGFTPSSGGAHRMDGGRRLRISIVLEMVARP